MTLTRVLRKAYDGEREFRGKPDQTTVEYSLSAPIAIAGEQALSDGAMLERIIAVEMSPNSLDDNMRKSYETLRELPLNAFMSRFIPFSLNTNFESELNKAEVWAADLLDLDTLPDRVRKNLTVMIFGFSQFIRFGVEQGILSNEQVSDMEEATRGATHNVKDVIVGEDGVTKVALDYMVEHLAIMAETGRLKHGQDYKVQAYGDIVIRLDACLAEYRKFHRETQLDGELLDAKAYRKQLKENYDRGGYVTDVGVVVKMGKQPKRVVALNPEHAEKLGIDLDGFRGNTESRKGVYRCVVGYTPFFLPALFFPPVLFELHCHFRDASKAWISCDASLSGCVPSGTSTMQTNIFFVSRGVISCAAARPPSSPSSITTTLSKCSIRSCS